MKLFTSLTGQCSDFAPACVVLTRSVSGTSQRIPITAVENTACAIFDVRLRTR